MSLGSIDGGGKGVPLGGATVVVGATVVDVDSGTVVLDVVVGASVVAGGVVVDVVVGAAVDVLGVVVVVGATVVGGGGSTVKGAEPK